MTVEITRGVAITRLNSVNIHLKTAVELYLLHAKQTGNRQEEQNAGSTLALYL